MVVRTLTLFRPSLCALPTRSPPSSSPSPEQRVPLPLRRPPCLCVKHSGKNRVDLRWKPQGQRECTECTSSGDLPRFEVVIVRSASRDCEKHFSGGWGSRGHRCCFLFQCTPLSLFCDFAHLFLCDAQHLVGRLYLFLPHRGFTGLAARRARGARRGT